MCQFNFIVLKEKSNQAEIGKIASDFNLNFIEKDLTLVGMDNIKTFLTTTGNCDCGSVIGKQYSDDNSLPDWQKERKKLERKRFSDRRINLLIEQKKQEYADKNADDINQETLETKKWTDFLNDDRLKKGTEEVGVLYHQFSGNLENEKIRIENETIIPADKIDLEFLRKLKENRIIWVK